MNKKGQLTTFIVIGIALLFASGLILFIRDKTSGDLLEDDLKTSEKIPLALQPFKTYVELCLDDVFEDGVKKLGLRGGYIDPLSQNMEFNPNPTESDIVEFSPGSNLMIPYWYHLKSDNDCTTCEFSTNRPELYKSSGHGNSIENQLEQYIIAQLPSCLNNFESFKVQGYTVTVLGEISPEVKVTSMDVVTLLTYPLKIEGPKMNGEVTQYYSAVDVNLREIYELATEITNSQNNFSFLERNTMELITSFSGVDNNKLPPISATRLNPINTFFWLESAVKDKVQLMLMSYVPMLQVKGAKNYRRIVPKESEKYDLIQRIYDNMILPLETQHPQIDTNFFYLSSWPIYFDTNYDGELIKPESVFTELASFMGIQKFYTLYDVSYPIAVKIRQSNALKDDGYSFIFMLEANVRNNEALDAEFVEPLDFPDVPRKSMLCDPNKRNTGSIKINVTTPTGPVKDAAISYNCLDESCMMGATNEEGILDGRFPVCFGGTISVIKYGLLTKSYPLSTELDMENNVTVGMNELIEIPVVIKKKRFSKTVDDWVLNPNPLTLDNDNEATLMFTMKDSLYEQKHTAAMFATGLEPNGTVRLAPGTYDISGTLLYSGDVKIEAEEREESGVSYKLPAIDFSQNGSLFNEGGLDLENFTITYEDLITSEKLIVYMVSVNPSSFKKIEDLEMLGNYGALTEENRIVYIPQFEAK